MATTQTPLDLSRQDALLRAREAELQALVAAHGQGALHMDAPAADVSDFKEAAGAQAQAALDDAVSGKATVELQAVVAARRRIAEGSYGTCAECGDEIGAQRLLAMPSASLCAHCQQDLERSRRA